MRRSEPSAKVLLHVDENSIAASPISQAYEDTERRRIACRDMTTILFGPTPLNTSDKCTLLRRVGRMPDSPRENPQSLSRGALFRGHLLSREAVNKVNSCGVGLIHLLEGSYGHHVIA